MDVLKPSAAVIDGVPGSGPPYSHGTPDESAAWSTWRRRHCTPAFSRGMAEVAITVIPFVLIWSAMYWATAHGHLWLYAALLPLATGFLVRLFIIQHDCGHQAFLPSRRANDWLGRCLGVLTLTPYAHWNRAHALHHASSGNLDRRGVGDIDTLTIAEYRGRSRRLRWGYRVYRSPPVMFCIGPVFVFLLQNRIPTGSFRTGWRHWASALGTDLSIAGVVILMGYSIGLGSFLVVQGPIMLLSASVGGWLFYVQHQFENTRWSRGNEWGFRDAALQGSSHYDLHPVLRWFTANIGLHDVHHLCSRIPFYRLPQATRRLPEPQHRNRLTLRQSFKCAKLALWDEESQRLVSFREAARMI
ncbi:MAG: fatty acid desaturase [Xanthomonadaceae bacterium]|nr:fatty acid desaturase [Xanthomonadaceae bacterium]